MQLPGFIGPTYQNRSLIADAERTINLYPEIIDGGATGKAKVVFHGTPGLEVWAQTGAGPVRALWAADGRCFAVSGSRFVELLPNASVVSRGTVTPGPSPATISSNGTSGHQLFIVASGTPYLYDLNANTWTDLTATIGAGQIRMGAFLDGYFLALVAKSNIIRYTTDLYDGTTWDGTDVFQRSQSTDEVRTLIISHREIWLLGSRSTEVWYNNGDQDVPFAPISGATLDVGIAAPWSAAILDNTLFWVGADSRGVGIVYRANGYTPARISCHALETALTRAGRLDDLIAYSYQEDGHTYYVLYGGALPTTWVYDCATQLWHERAHWNTDLMRWEPHVGRCHAYAFTRHLIGDRTSGIVYSQSLDLYDEELATTVFGAQIPETPGEGGTSPYDPPTGGEWTTIATTTGSSRDGLADQTLYYKVVALYGTTESAGLVIGPVVTTATEKRVGIRWDAYSTAAVNGVSPTGLRVYRATDAAMTTGLVQLDLTKYPVPEAPGNMTASTHGTPGSASYGYRVKAWNPYVGYSDYSSTASVTDGTDPGSFGGDNYVEMDWWEDAAIDTGFFDIAGADKLWSVVFGRSDLTTWLDVARGNYRDDGDDIQHGGLPFAAPTVTADLPITARWLLDDWPGLADSGSVPWMTVT